MYFLEKHGRLYTQEIKSDTGNVLYEKYRAYLSESSARSVVTKLGIKDIDIVYRENVDVYNDLRNELKWMVRNIEHSNDISALNIDDTVLRLNKIRPIVYKELRNMKQEIQYELYKSLHISKLHKNKQDRTIFDKQIDALYVAHEKHNQKGFGEF